MKVKDLISFLQTLDKEKELLFADYYYSDREGFIPWNAQQPLSNFITQPQKTQDNKNYPNNVYLVDFKYRP